MTACASDAASVPRPGPQVIRLVTFATTARYVEGMVCLAQSLAHFEISPALVRAPPTAPTAPGEGADGTVPMPVQRVLVECQGGRSLALQLLPLVAYCSAQALQVFRDIVAGEPALALLLEPRLLPSSQVAAAADAAISPPQSTEGVPSGGEAGSTSPVASAPPNSIVVPTHNGRGARIAFDAPRRMLWAAGEPFVYIDADIICVRNPWAALAAEVVALSASAGGAGRGGGVGVDGAVAGGNHHAIAACPSFRIKKQRFNPGGAGYFNAGLIVCVAPQPEDAAAIERVVQAATAAAAAAGADPSKETTEEQLLGDVFAGRWRPLSPKFNLVKRVAKFAPALWRELAPEALFLHYVGAKPWWGWVRTGTARDALLTAPDGGGGGGDGDDEGHGGGSAGLEAAAAVNAQAAAAAAAAEAAVERRLVDWDADGYDDLEQLWCSVRVGAFGGDGARLTESFMQLRA
jgi:hypothetical protein